MQPKSDERVHEGSSEKKLSKYERSMVLQKQSLEAIAVKTRKTTMSTMNANHGSGKKTIGMSTQATDPFEARFGALSISSCISKNTGSQTILAKEKIAAHMKH